MAMVQTYAPLPTEDDTSSSDSDYGDGTSSEDNSRPSSPLANRVRTSSTFGDVVEKRKVSSSDVNDSIHTFFGGANKYGNLDQRVKWIIETVISGSVLLAVGIFNSLLWVVAKFNDLFLLFFYGLVLLAFREVILLLCPPLASVSIFLAEIIDVMLIAWNLAFNALFDGVNLLMGFINKDVVAVINDVASKIPGARKVGTINFSGLRWKNIPGPDPQQVHSFLANLPPTCARLDSMPKIVLFLIQLFAGPSMCPVVRYLWPLEHRYSTDVGSTLFDWTYSGDADPVLFDSQKNCVAAGAHSQSLSGEEMACLCLGICFLYLEFFLPIVILRAIVPNIYPGISPFIAISLYFFDMIVESSTEVVATFVKSVLLF